MQSHAEVSLKERQNLITRLTCFAGLTSQESAELAMYMIEEVYEAGDLIVVEGELVDSVYIIVKGQAEVVSKVPKTKNEMPIARLGAGEAIGLNDTGFFSTTGHRTATVIAVTEILLLKIDLKNLHHFLETHPSLRFEMYAATEQLARLEFVKQVLPFHQLSRARLHWLADKIEILQIPANTVLIHKNEMSQGCYLINAGEVRVGDKCLDAPTIFSEATTVMSSPYREDIIVTKNAELFFLRYDYLAELLETEKNISQISKNSKPQQNPKIDIHKNIAADKQIIFILKNVENGCYIKLSEQGFLIWQQLDGKKKIKDVFMIFPQIPFTAILALISKLLKNGFLLADNRRQRWMKPFLFLLGRNR